jgi:hypothetical protein
LSLISVSIVGLRLGLYGFARSAREGLETSGWDVDADRARLSTIVGKDALLSIGGNRNTFDWHFGVVVRRDGDARSILETRGLVVRAKRISGRGGGVPPSSNSILPTMLWIAYTCHFHGGANG